MNTHNKKYQVLIVDDIAENLKILSNVLFEQDLEISFAINGMQALETVSISPPDLILLDISMPEMDGYEVCKRLKADAKTKQIPVIFLTARTNSEDIIRGFEVGGVDYITKPYNHTELISRVFTHLELKTSRDIIAQQVDELKQLNSAKDTFLSIMAHDLKNPFNTVMGFSELLLKNEDKLPKEKIRKYYSYIYNSARSGFTLLENLLQWARMQTGSLQVIPVSIDIEEIIKKVLEFILPTAAQKNIHISPISVEKNMPVFFDKEMVHTVLRNLLSNAVKFSHEGGEITIGIDNTDIKTIVSVTDKGVGISETNRAKIFTINQQLSTEGTASERGTGLGLILCKEFVEKNGGELWFESEQGKGSTFYFSMPHSESKEKFSINSQNEQLH